MDSFSRIVFCTVLLFQHTWSLGKKRFMLFFKAFCFLLSSFSFSGLESWSRGVPIMIYFSIPPCQTSSHHHQPHPIFDTNKANAKKDLMLVGNYCYYYYYYYNYYYYYYYCIIIIVIIIIKYHNLGSFNLVLETEPKSNHGANLSLTTWLTKYFLHGCLPSLVVSCFELHED